MGFKLTAVYAVLVLGLSMSILSAAPIAGPPAAVGGGFSQTLQPFPPPRSIRQSAVIGGKRVDYQLTVGSIALKDENGKLLGEVVYTAFTVPGQDASRRPVTFAVNGGPGAASAYLDLGAIGPKKVDFGGKQAYPSDPPILHDNPNSWLDFTDLVFIDPIGTGYSRSRVDEAQTKQAFLTSKSDIEYLSRVVFDWLLQNDRMMSPKYLVGESYGGDRVPRMAHYLQTTLGVGISGITMSSPALDTGMSNEDVLSTTLEMVNLPAMAAGHLEQQGMPVNAQTMEPIELYARTQFVTDLLAGPADQAATDRLSAKVAELTGLDPALVRRLNGRVDIWTYLRESHRQEGLVGSGYDSNYTTFNPFPAEEQEQPYDDPLFSRPTALFVSAMTNLIVNQVGWKVNARYYLNDFDLNRQFVRDDHDSPVAALREALAADPTMSATIANGYNDFACPYFMSKLILAQQPAYVRQRVKLYVYPGGHMFYSRPGSAAAFRRDIKAVYESRQ